MGPGRPLLEVGHLEPGGGVDPVGRLEQAGQQDRPQVGAGVLGLDGVADGVDAGAVLGPEVPRRRAEGLGDVARAARHARSAGRPPRPRRPRSPRSAARVGGHVAAGQHVGAPGAVDRGDLEAQPPSRPGPPGWSRRTGRAPVRAPEASASSGEGGHQAALGPQVLDHRRGAARSPAPEPAEPPVGIAGVGVEVVGDLAHHPVEGPARRPPAARRPPGPAGPACGRPRSRAARCRAASTPPWARRTPRRPPPSRRRPRGTTR